MSKKHFIWESVGNSIPAFLVVSAALFAGSVRAATVTNSADIGPGSLREAIANAISGETIDFAITGPITLTSEELVIDKDLTIQGPGSGSLTIQRSADPGTPDFRILRALNASVTLSGLTMNNGRADYGGGLLIEYSAVVLMRDIILSGNSATSAGGGLSNDGMLALEDSAFIGNFVQAIDDYGAYGGGLANWQTIEWLDRCLFQGNSVSGGPGDGGAFGGALNNSGTIWSMDGGVLQGNSANGGPGNGYASGGAINNDFGTLTLTSCTLTGNSATGGAVGASGFGGGLNNDYGTVYVDASTVRGNVARGGSGSEGGLAEGGGVANGFGTIELNRSTVSGNLVVGGEGDNGGFGEGGGVANDYGTVYLYNSTVSGNVANGGAGTVSAGVPHGGGLFNGFASMIVSHSTVAANVVSGGAPNDGGGIFNLEGFVEIKNTIVAANNATVDAFNDQYAQTFSYGFNSIGSTAGLFTAGPADQFNLSAAMLQLGPLQDNGGPTFTHALLCGSPALNAGDNTDAPDIDQRGFLRVVGGLIDIGAYEASSNTAPGISCPGPITLNCAPPTGQAANLSVGVADADGDPLVVVWSVNGTAYQTNVVAAGGPPTAAQVDLAAVFGVGSHQITVAVSDPSGCSATCSTTVDVLTGGFASPVAGACSLGEAGGYAVFIMGNVAGTKSAISSANTKITGHVAVGPSATGSSSDLLKATITGTLFLDPAADVDIHSDLIVSGGLAGQNLTAARNDALAASVCYAALTPTLTINSLTASTTLTGNGGLNVINVGSVVLVKKVLTLTGGPNDVFIFNVSGDFSLGSSQIKLEGGLNAGQVLWNFPGAGTTVNVYKDVTSASGIFLVPFRDYVQDVAALNGAVIAGGNVRIHSGATVTYPSGCNP